MAKGKKATFRDVNGRFIAKEVLSKRLARSGLTLSDYERGRVAVSQFGSKNPLKDLFSSLENLSTVRDLEEDYSMTIASIRSLPRNKYRASLNGKRISKEKLAYFISDYPSKFRKPFHFFYLNHRFSSNTIEVQLDDELAALVNEADWGDRVEDSYGNVVQISS